MRKWLTPTSNIGFCLQIIAMSKKKCNHLVCIANRYGYSKNITEKQFLDFAYALGSITAKYEAIATVDKHTKKYLLDIIASEMGIEVSPLSARKSILTFRFQMFSYCPFCGEEINEGTFWEKHKSKYSLAKSRVDKEKVIKRFLKRKLEEEEKQLKRNLELAERRKSNKENNGYVYVCRLDKHYKIGISKNPHSRLQEFTLLPYELETVLIEKVNGYDKREKELHEHFADKRVRGEWFELNEEDIEYIKEYLKSYEVK